MAVPRLGMCVPCLGMYVPCLGTKKAALPFFLEGAAFILFIKPFYIPLAFNKLEASGCFMPVKSVNISSWSLVLPRLRILSLNA